jgi:uncharacterized membrane protein YfhO
MPAAFLVPASGSFVIEDETAQLARVKDPSFNPEREVVLTKPISQEASRSKSASASRVEWLSKRTNTFELNVTANEPGILVISQIDYPGWKATVDGQPTDIVRANYALPAIFVPEGEHRVIFSFQPVSFRIGLLLSAISLCVVAIMFRR